jgi:voltage-gated sodium channel
MSFIHKAQNFLDRLHENKTFQFIVIAIILLSSLMIGIDTYPLGENWVIVLRYLDWFVTIFFLVEVVTKFLSYKKPWQFFRSFWNIFDLTIVTLSLIPLENSDYVLVARILRIFRVMRLISFIPELRLLIGALVKAIPKMSYILLLMFIIFYVYGTFGSILFSEINPQLWANVGISMLTLFRVATFEDWTDVMYETMEIYPLSWIYYFSFIFFSAFVFLNMMIGVILEVMASEYKDDRSEKKSVSTDTLKEDIRRLETKLDTLLRQTTEKGA